MTNELGPCWRELKSTVQCMPKTTNMHIHWQHVLITMAHSTCTAIFENGKDSCTDPFEMIHTYRQSQPPDCLFLHKIPVFIYQPPKRSWQDLVLAEICPTHFVKQLNLPFVNTKPIMVSYVDHKYLMMHWSGVWSNNGSFTFKRVHLSKHPVS